MSILKYIGPFCETDTHTHTHTHTQTDRQTDRQNYICRAQTQYLSAGCSGEEGEGRMSVVVGGKGE